MNNNIVNNLITVDEYFSLLAKNDALTAEENKSKTSFEEFIRQCKTYEDLLSPAAAEVYANYQKGLANIYSKPEHTPKEDTVIYNFQEDIDKKNKEIDEERALTRKLDKAGFVNATIILVMILNVGIMIAMILLGNK